MCVIKRMLMFENYKNCLFNDKNILKLQQRFKSDHHEVYTEEVNKVALSSDDNKRQQTFDGDITFPYGANGAFIWSIYSVWKWNVKSMRSKREVKNAEWKLEMLSKECESEMHMK